MNIWSSYWQLGIQEGNKLENKMRLVKIRSEEGYFFSKKKYLVVADIYLEESLEGRKIIHFLIGWNVFGRRNVPRRRDNMVKLVGFELDGLSCIHGGLLGWLWKDNLLF
jgi:hypothetical protein